MPINCYMCGILIGEDHLETAAYRYKAGYICTDCNETFLVKKRKLTVNEWAKTAPVKYVPVMEIPPFAYHIANIELRQAIRVAMLKANWYVWIQEKFLITWMPPDRYEDLLNKMAKGSTDATGKSVLRQETVCE